MSNNIQIQSGVPRSLMTAEDIKEQQQELVVARESRQQQLDAANTALHRQIVRQKASLPDMPDALADLLLNAKRNRLNKGAPFIDARRLYEALGVRTQFRDWWARRVESEGFAEDRDFRITTDAKPTGPEGGRPESNYLVTLDAANRIAMTTRTAAGRQAREALSYMAIMLQDAADEAKRHLDDIQAARALGLDVYQYRHNLARHEGRVVPISETTERKITGGRYGGLSAKAFAVLV